jgi:hypothetical protein
LRDELDLQNEKALTYKKDASLVDVYKKKIDSFREIEQELEDSKMQN